MVGLETIEGELDLWGHLFNLWPRDAHHKFIMWNWDIGGMHLEFVPRTMIMSWVVMVLVLIFVIAATRNMDLRRPKGVQNILEMVFEGIRGQINQAMDPRKALGIFSVAVTLIIYILISNLIGLIPTLTSPTADPNTTFGLALITFALIWFYGIRQKGIGYFKHWFKPWIFFLPLNILEEFVKPVTLAARLYGNIYAGEVLICTWLGMFYGWKWILGGFLASTVWLGFSIFVGCIQAYVFTVLTINYVAMALADDH